MMTDELLSAAAQAALERHVARVTRDYDPTQPHCFSLTFERKIQKLRRRANHLTLYRAAHQAAAVVLVLLVSGSAWLTVDVQARSTLFGWIKELYETHVVYRFSGDTSGLDSSTTPDCYELNWIPDGYVKSRETDTGERVTTVYKNEDGQLLKFYYIYEPGETDIFVVTDGGEVKKTLVGDFAADLIVFPDSSAGNAILWTDDYDHVFYISGFVSENDLLNMAVSLTQKNF